MSTTLRAALLQALSGTLPDREQTLLLRACLMRGAESRAAWQQWRAGIADPIEALSDRKRWARTLLPLLMTSLIRSEAEVESRTLSYLRAAFLREQLRFGVYRSLCRQVLASLAAERVPAILLKGAAFAQTLYETPTHRHCHDIDILTHAADSTRIRTILAAQGFLPAPSPGNPAHALFTHASGLPLRVHTRPFLHELYKARVEDLLARSEPVNFDGSVAVVLCPVDALVHLCGNVSVQPGVEKLRWVCDAWLLIHHTPHLDWAEVVERAVGMNVTVPLSAQLGYLWTELDAPIPARVHLHLRSSAALSSLSTIRAAFIGTLLEGWPGLRRCARGAADWRAAALLATWAGLEGGASRLRISRAQDKRVAEGAERQ